jgi:hypothetical protein
MAFRTKLVRAEALIVAFLGTSTNAIYSRIELRNLFHKARRNDLVASHTTLDEFINFLILRRHLISITLEHMKFGHNKSQNTAKRSHDLRQAVRNSWVLSDRGLLKRV